MKRLLTILCALAFIGFAQAGNAQVYFQEDFQSGMGNWISIDNDGKTVDPNNAQITQGLGVTKLGWGVPAQAGYVISTSWYTPAGQADDWLISPPIQVGPDANLEWNAMAFDPQFPDGYEVYLSEGGTEMSDFSTILYTLPKENSNWTARYVSLADYNGKSIRIAFRNNSTDQFILALRNIQVLKNTDGAVALSTNLPQYLNKDEGSDVKLSILNSGTNSINSIDFAYQAVGETIAKVTLTDLNIPYLSILELTHPTKWMPASNGKKKVSIWIEKVNGKDVDVIKDDDKIETNVIVYDDINSKAWATPLIEEFTSSTCPPCATLNKTFNPLIETNKEKITIIKYQMNWPSPGDKYFNTDGGTRRDYYGVSSVPDVYFIGGEPSGAPNSQAAFDALALERAFFDLNASYKVNDKSVSVIANITTLSDMFKTANVKAHIAVIENKTTGNKGSNGETEFHYVMQKMMPNGEGTVIDQLDPQASQELNYNYTFTTTDHVEEMSDLSVVVFLQDVTSKRVLASVWATNTSDVDDNSGNGIIGLFPNPAVDFARIRYNVVGQQDVNIALFNMNGEELVSINRANLTDGVYFEDLNTKALSSGSYFVKLTIGGKTHTRTINVVK